MEISTSISTMAPTSRAVTAVRIIRAVVAVNDLFTNLIIVQLFLIHFLLQFVYKKYKVILVEMFPMVGLKCVPHSPVSMDLMDSCLTTNQPVLLRVP